MNIGKSWQNVVIIRIIRPGFESFAYTLSAGAPLKSVVERIS
jgi:hypothetical protein